MKERGEGQGGDGRGHEEREKTFVTATWRERVDACRHRYFSTKQHKSYMATGRLMEGVKRRKQIKV